MMCERKCEIVALKMFPTPTLLPLEAIILKEEKENREIYGVSSGLLL